MILVKIGSGLALPTLVTFEEIALKPVMPTSSVGVTLGGKVLTRSYCIIIYNNIVNTSCLNYNFLSTCGTSDGFCVRANLQQKDNAHSIQASLRTDAPRAFLVGADHCDRRPSRPRSLLVCQKAFSGKTRKAFAGRERKKPSM